MPARTSPRQGRNPSARATDQLGTFSGRMMLISRSTSSTSHA